MAKLKFGAWIATYAWADGGTGPENMRRIHEAIEKCEEHGIDVKIATGILVLPVRHPVVLAKEISTLCHLSNE